jgi:putative transposase
MDPSPIRELRQLRDENARLRAWWPISRWTSTFLCLHRGPVPVPSAPHERWSVDFVHDQLFDGRPFRILTVLDQLSRESPLIEVAFAMSGPRVRTAIDKRSEDVPLPLSITVDHGSEFTSKALEEWGMASRREARFQSTRKT